MAAQKDNMAVCPECEYDMQGLCHADGWLICPECGWEGRAAEAKRKQRAPVAAVAVVPVGIWFSGLLLYYGVGAAAIDGPVSTTFAVGLHGWVIGACALLSLLSMAGPVTLAGARWSWGGGAALVAWWLLLFAGGAAILRFMAVLLSGVDC